MISSQQTISLVGSLLKIRFCSHFTISMCLPLPKNTSSESKGGGGIASSSFTPDFINISYPTSTRDSLHSWLLLKSPGKALMIYLFRVVQCTTAAVVFFLNSELTLNWNAMCLIEHVTNSEGMIKAPRLSYSLYLSSACKFVNVLIPWKCQIWGAGSPMSSCFLQLFTLHHSFLCTYQKITSLLLRLLNNLHDNFIHISSQSDPTKRNMAHYGYESSLQYKLPSFLSFNQNI